MRETNYKMFVCPKYVRKKSEKPKDFCITRFVNSSFDGGGCSLALLGGKDMQGGDAEKIGLPNRSFSV